MGQEVPLPTLQKKFIADLNDLEHAKKTLYVALVLLDQWYKIFNSSSGQCGW